MNMNIKLKDVLTENTIKIKTDIFKHWDLPSSNLHNKETIIWLNKTLKKYGFKYKGKTPGSYPSDYWYYSGKQYGTGYYRLTGNVQRDYIEMEEINI